MKTKPQEKKNMITARFTDHEKRMLEDLMELYEKDRTSALKFAVKKLWLESFIGKNDDLDYIL